MLISGIIECTINGVPLEGNCTRELPEGTRVYILFKNTNGKDWDWRDKLNMIVRKCEVFQFEFQETI